ncbi:MAG: sigma-70 family RNA polymerase sigma factor [bacterium]|nr:sigma-70 family RNA polymerase sigma factor [bacterium]
MSDNKGGHEKFDRLYKEFYRYSYKVAFNIIHDINQMEDVMQEVWLNIWRSIDIITDNQSAKAWISTLAHNTAKNILDKKIVKDKRFIDIDNDVLYAVTPDFEDDPVDIAASNENIEYIYRKMRELDKKYSDVLLLKHKFNCTPDEISKLLHTNPKTIYTRLERGKKMLKNKLLNAERSEMK